MTAQIHQWGKSRITRGEGGAAHRGARCQLAERRCDACRCGLLLAGLAELALKLSDLIRRYWPLGAPLWPPVASSAYAALLSGEEQYLFSV